VDGGLLLVPLVLGPYLGGVLTRRLADAGAADGQPGRDLAGSIGLVMAAAGVWAFIAGAHAWRPLRAQKWLLASAGVLLVVAAAYLAFYLVRFLGALYAG
jgi:hypothetical protein